MFVAHRGHFVNGEDGYPQYVGGSIISRTIKEDMTYEELKTIVATIVFTYCFLRVNCTNLTYWLIIEL